MTSLPGRSLTVLSIVLTSLLCVTTAPVAAQEGKTISAKATGQIVAAEPCGDNICQVAVVTGASTRLGTFVGELHESVDLLTGLYTGTATFTFAAGTLSTAYTGQVLSEVDGVVTFQEDHHIVEGTGRLEGTTGSLDVLGSADETGALSISGSGVIIR